MISVRVTQGSSNHTKAEATIYFVPESFDFAQYCGEFAKSNCSFLQQLMEKHRFTGSLGSELAVPIERQGVVSYALFVGLGKALSNGSIPVENMRRAVGTAIKKSMALKSESCCINVPDAGLFGVSEGYLVEQIVIISNMASYHFNEFITDANKKFSLFEIVLCGTAGDCTESIKRGEIIAKGVNTARHWIDLPPSDLTPPQLADKARAIAKEYGLAIEVFDEKKVNSMGMGGLAGVARGSDNDCQFVILRYTTAKKDAPTLCFVGKGITFDSGGLSLKPAQSMETMKEDMAGAAAVITAMQIIAQLKPDVNVIGITPLAENLPSGKAIMPGDILNFYNGKTAEVKNTDAEGRLILADALAYASLECKPDMIIDIATLTGACTVAVGPFYIAMVSQHEELKERVKASSRATGERVWELPMDEDYRKAVASDVADVANIGASQYRASTITPAFFLQEFVGQTPWVHLDIGSSAYNTPDISYLRPGATGVGVRLLVDIALQWR